MIPVSKPYLPCRKKFDAYIDRIFESQCLSNGGPLHELLTKRLEKYLGVKNLLLVSNGTMALQIAYKALGISDRGSCEASQAITTPFTFVATASSLQWEGVDPVFADIDSNSWCISPDNIELAITERTNAIVPVHVFGNACDVVRIDDIARRHQLKVVYDASHAFGVSYKGESILRWGDAATLSFHATKLFHTIEGGAIVFKHRSDYERACKMVNFGVAGSEAPLEVGINAKMSEVQAAMGLCILDEMGENSNARQKIYEQYLLALPRQIVLQKKSRFTSANYAYMPIVLNDEQQVLRLMDCLAETGIYARRYFHPSLSETIYGSDEKMPDSERISKRVVCLPLFAGLLKEEVDYITQIVSEVVAG